MRLNKVLTISTIIILVMIISSSFAFEVWKNRKTALEVSSILSIHDNESYLDAKKRASKHLSQSLNSATFSPLEYNGLNIPEPNVQIHSLKADLRDNKNVIVKADFSLYYDNLKWQDATLLITIVNGLVTGIERI